MVDLDTPIDQVTLAFCDVETTGLSPSRGDRVCEVAVLRCRGLEVEGSFAHLVNPRRPSSSGAYAVHHIAETELLQAPPFIEVAPQLLRLLEGAVFVGHNAPFDLDFITAELRRVGMPVPQLLALDTLLLARKTFDLSSYSLRRVSRALGLRVQGQAHRAMADVLLTRELFLHLVRVLWRQGIRTLRDYVAHQGDYLRIKPEPGISSPLPPLLREALLGNYLLRLRYLSRQGRVTERLVFPLRVSERRGQLLLEGYCFLRQAQRAFRLDHILQMELVERDWSKWA
ncbi:MAG: WYL domain-containing protein [Anaerolineae bacterium]|nr:WYL domain-containing protein [Anaerolineae bacterium]